MIRAPNRRAYAPSPLVSVLGAFPAHVAHARPHARGDLLFVLHPGGGLRHVVRPHPGCPRPVGPQRGAVGDVAAGDSRGAADLDGPERLARGAPGESADAHPGGVPLSVRAAFPGGGAECVGVGGRVAGGGLRGEPLQHRGEHAGRAAGALLSPLDHRALPWDVVAGGPGGRGVGAGVGAVGGADVGALRVGGGGGVCAAVVLGRGVDAVRPRVGVCAGGGWGARAVAVAFDALSLLDRNLVVGVHGVRGGHLRLERGLFP